MDTATLQERLDVLGELTVPAGVWFPTEPLFLDKSCAVYGAGPRSVMRCDYSGSAFVFGVERGTIPESRFVPGVGFRTGAGDDHIHVWQSDGDWVTGPREAVNGWLSVRKLRVQFAGVCNDNGGDFSGAGLCGIQGPDTVAPDPMPWCLYAEDGKVCLSLRTLAGKHVYTAPLPSGPDLDCVFEVDFIAGTVTSSTGTTTALTSPIAVNSFLYSNLNHGFAVGSLHPHAGSRGYFGGAHRDMTIRFVNVRYNDNSAGACHLHAGNGRFGSSYDQYKSLPLISQQPGGFMYLVPVAATGWRGGDIEVRGVRIQGRAGSAAMAQGWVEGGLLLQDVHCVGGTRSYTSIGNSVGYPVIMNHCNYSGASDCLVYAVRNTVGSVIRDTQFKFGRRCSLHALGCEFLIDNVMDAPPSIAPDACMIFEGGTNEVHKYHGDLEYEIPPEFVAIKVRPAHFGDDFVTKLVASGVSFRAPVSLNPDTQLYRTLPAQSGYDVSKLFVEVNGNVLA